MKHQTNFSNYHPAHLMYKKGWQHITKIWHSNTEYLRSIEKTSICFYLP